LLNFNVGFCKIEFLSKSGFFCCENINVFQIYLGSIGIENVFWILKRNLQSILWGPIYLHLSRTSLIVKLPLVH
jgi:hypothetical protein